MYIARIILENMSMDKQISAELLVVYASNQTSVQRLS